MRRLAAAGELNLASGSSGTWPADNPSLFRLPLDQVYLGRCLVPVSERRGPAIGSDHLPVVTDVAVGNCRG
jgi:endonuclease/exonuclease/phosphatase (EEP) superfamily protein YafD